MIRAPALDQGTMDSAQMLATGDPVYSPVSAPAWNPMGHTIAYTGVGTGTSQVYVVASGGGTPTRITNEGGGAFSPTWSADGTKIYYIAPVPELILRRIDATGTNPMNAIPDSLTASGPASCNASYCIFAAAMGAIEQFNEGARVDAGLDPSACSRGPPRRNASRRSCSRSVMRDR